MPESVGDLQLEEIDRRVQLAIENLERKEFDLFKPLGSERNIAQRFARWLESEFPDWNIDCEYDQIFDGTSEEARHKVAELLMHRVRGGFVKLHEPVEVRVIPDIIIHRRQKKENLLAIEVKTSFDREEIDFDYEKLRAYREYEPLRYRFALFIRFQKLQEDGQIVADLSFL